MVLSSCICVYNKKWTMQYWSSSLITVSKYKLNVSRHYTTAQSRFILVQKNKLLSWHNTCKLVNWSGNFPILWYSPHKINNTSQSSPFIVSNSMQNDQKWPQCAFRTGGKPEVIKSPWLVVPKLPSAPSGVTKLTFHCCAHKFYHFHSHDYFPFLIVIFL